MLTKSDHIYDLLQCEAQLKLHSVRLIEDWSLQAVVEPEEIL